MRTLSQVKVNTLINEIPLNTQAVPLEEDMENCEINSKLGLGFTPRPKLRKPIPKPRKTLVVSKQ